MNEKMNALLLSSTDKIKIFVEWNKKNWNSGKKDKWKVIGVWILVFVVFSILFRPDEKTSNQIGTKDILKSCEDYKKSFSMNDPAKGDKYFNLQNMYKGKAYSDTGYLKEHIWQGIHNDYTIKTREGLHINDLDGPNLVKNGRKSDGDEVKISGTVETIDVDLTDIKNGYCAVLLIHTVVE